MTVDPLRRTFGLDGRVAIVTGAASGIGKATARLFAAAGARVVVADLDGDGARTVAAEVDGLALPFDLADDASIVAMVAAAMQAFGRVDILVNNAGIYPRRALREATEADWQRMQRINVWGSLIALREAAAAMRAGGSGGRIVNISSVGAARTAVNDQILYNASKAAMDSMTQSAALELAKDAITVNSVLPGAVRALNPRPLHNGPLPTGPLLDAGRILLGRRAEPDEIAAPILMLASEAGAYITGQTLVVDGGFTVS